MPDAEEAARRRIGTTVTLVLTLLFAVPVAAHASGTVYTWVGNTQTAGADNHSWTDARNWNPSGVPGTGDSVTIEQPSNTDCFAHVDAVPTVTLARFTLVQNPALCTTSVSGGAISVSGTFTWNGGALDTPTVLGASSTATIAGSNQRLDALTQNLEVDGQLTLLGDVGSGALQILHGRSLHVAHGATLVSNGSNEIDGSACCTSPAKVVNDGTLLPAGGTLTISDAELDQRATVASSAGGTLVTSGAPITTGATGSYTGAGRWTIEDRAAAVLSGTQTLGAGFHLEFGGLASVFTSFLGGTVTLAGTGTFDWTGGVLQAGMTIAHGVAVHVAGVHTGGAARVLRGRDYSLGGAGVPVTQTNHGTITVTAGATISTSAQTRLVNAVDGVLALAPGTSIGGQSCCASPDRIVNAGTVLVPAAPGTAAVPLTFLSYQSSGTTSIAAGHALLLSGGATGTLAGGTITGGGQLTVATPVSLSGTVNVAAHTALRLDPHGTIQGTATLGGAGAMRWTGGNLVGNLTLGPVGGIAVVGAAAKAVANSNSGAASVVRFAAVTTIGSGTAAAHDAIGIGSASALVLQGTTYAGNFVDFAGGHLVNKGRFSIGAGRVSASAYQQVALGLLAVTLGSTQKGLLQVAGPATLAGTLALRNTYQPVVGAAVYVVKAVTLIDALTCRSTSGTGATAGHWADTHTTTLLRLSWRRGRTLC
ncbi:MAG TPA: hypothetical protein VGN18_06460 [Jatrophihabitans sp.]|jgi:hypothetical protein|uniref:hypothetical protein n=1 Tax=Jatrophihabitans sp. TaxID=1932789 RepID=UPI002DFAD777|nr:hypothetical protein [Jatrophihabitans sp.]